METETKTGTFRLGETTGFAQAKRESARRKREMRMARLQALAEKAAKAKTLEAFIADMAKEALSADGPLPKNREELNDRVFKAARAIKVTLLEVKNQDAWSRYRRILKGLRREMDRVSCTQVACPEEDLDAVLSGWGPNGEDIREAAGVADRLADDEWDLCFRVVRETAKAAGCRWQKLRQWPRMRTFGHLRKWWEKGDGPLAVREPGETAGVV
jgi:hypothetical protein